MNTKPMAIALIILVVLNLALFAFGVISQLLFWIVVILIALIVYKVMPKLGFIQK